METPKEERIFMWMCILLFFPITGVSFKKHHEEAKQRSSECASGGTTQRPGLHCTRTEWGGDYISTTTCLCRASTVSSTLLKTEASLCPRQGNCWKLPVILEKCHAALHARWLLMKVMKVHAWKWSPIPYLVLSFFLFWMHESTDSAFFYSCPTKSPLCFLLLIKS